MSEYVNITWRVVYNRFEDKLRLTLTTYSCRSKAQSFGSGNYTGTKAYTLGIL